MRDYELLNSKRGEWQVMYVKSTLGNSKGKSKSSRTNSMGVPMQQYVGDSTKHGKSNIKTAAKTPKAKSKSISSGKVILLSLLVGVAGLIYLNHVFAVQKSYKEVLELQREYEKVKRLYADRKFTYDRMIGPAEVYERAKKLGLQDGGPAEGIIYIEKE